MNPANSTVSRCPSNMVASRNEQIVDLPIIGLHMAQTTPTSSFAVSRSSVASFQPSAVNLQQPSGAQNVTLVQPLPNTVDQDVAIVRTPHLGIELITPRLKNLFKNVVDHARPSYAPDFTETRREIIEQRLTTKTPLRTSTLSNRRARNPPAAPTPEQQVKKEAEEQMIATLGNIAEATFPHFRPLQDNFLKHAMAMLGANMSCHALSDATIEAFATVLLKQEPHRTRQELIDEVRQSTLSGLIDRVTASDPPTAALPVTTPPGKRKMPEYQEAAPQVAKQPRQNESMLELLKKKDGELDEQWVNRLLGLGLPYRVIQKKTGYASDTLRYTGHFTAVPAEALKIKNAMPAKNTFESPSAYALELDRRSQHLELSNQQKCALFGRSQSTLQGWGVIKILRPRAFMAMSRTDVRECTTPLAKAQKYKRENPSLNHNDLIALTGITKRELDKDPLFWKFSEAGIKIFHKEKRRSDYGPMGEPPETEKEFAIRLDKTYNLDPANPVLTLTDISLISRVSLSTVRSLAELKKPTDDTEALKLRYPQEGRNPLEWALFIRHQNYKTPLEHISTVTGLDTWTIASNPDYLEWTAAAREAKDNVQPGERNSYQFSLYLHLVRPKLSAAEISRVTGYPVTSMRADKNERGDFATLFGDKFTPMRAKVLEERAKERLTRAATEVASSVVISATENSTTRAAAIDISAQQILTSAINTAATSTAATFVPAAVATRMEQWYEQSSSEGFLQVPVGYVGFSPPQAMTNPPRPMPLARPQTEAISPLPALVTPDARDIPMTPPQLMVYPPEAMQPAALSPLPASVTPRPEDMRKTPPSGRASASRMRDWLDDLPSLPSNLALLYVGGDEMELPVLESDMLIDETPWFPSDNDLILLAEGTLREAGGIHKQHVEWVLSMLVASVEFPEDVVLDITDRRYGVENNMKLRKPKTSPTANDKVISLVANQDMQIGNFIAPWWELKRQDGSNSSVPANSDALFISISQGLAEYGLTTFLVEKLHNMVADELALHAEIWLANMDMVLLRQHLENVRRNLSREKYIQLFGESPNRP